MSTTRRKTPGYDADGQMTGQIALFTLDGCDEQIRAEHADEGTCLANPDCRCRQDHRCEEENAGPA